MQASKMDITENSSSPWYALYTKHQHEKVASESLEKRGFEVLLPLYKTTSRWKDRTKTLYLPLFPCYSFVRADLARKGDILRTPGVFWIVESGGHACSIPDSEIEMIRKIMKGAAKAEPHPFLKCGDLVRVRSGALAGLEGILSRVKNQDRVVVNFELLKKAVAVEVEFSMLERVRAATEFPASGKDDSGREERRRIPGSDLRPGLEVETFHIA